MSFRMARRKQVGAIFLVALFSASLLAPAAYAIGPEQADIFRNGSRYFNYVLDGSSSCGSATDGASGGDVDSTIESDNVRAAFEYFVVAKKMAPFRAAAIIGNLQVEAPGLNPRQNQNNGGVGRGIAQWSAGERWVELQKWAGSKDIYDLFTQLDFIWYEMTTVAPWNKSLPAINAQTTLNGATESFMLTYEKPGEPHPDRRQAAAAAALKLYGNGAAPGGAPVSDIPLPEGLPIPDASGQCPSGGGFTGPPGETEKKGKGFTLKKNTDYSATLCAPGSKESRIYTHPVNNYKIRICVVDGTSIDVASIVSDRVVAMIKDIKAANISINGGGFRTYEEQLQARINNHCNIPPGPSNDGCFPPTAPPGNSQHERGLAIDFTSGGGTIRSGSSQFNWLKNNASKYGYYNLPSESWHWSTSGN